MERQLDWLINNAIDNRIFPGAVVLIGDQDQIEYIKPYGTTMYDDPES